MRATRKSRGWALSHLHYIRGAVPGARRKCPRRGAEGTVQVCPSVPIGNPGRWVSCPDRERVRVSGLNPTYVYTLAKLCARLFLVLLFAALCATHALAQPPSRVGLVVSMGNGAVETRCVDLREGKVSGYDLLVDSGLEVKVEFTGGGVKVCSIAGQGCPAENCWCKCQGGECTYWSYWHLVDGAWVYSPIGAAAYTVQPGSVEGWSWGEEPPPIFTLEQICASPASTPTYTPEPTATATQPPVPPTATSVSPTSTATATSASETSRPADHLRRTPVQVSTPTTAPTETPVPSGTPEPTATDLPPTATGIPTHTPSPTPDAPERPAGTNYWIFGIIVVVLVMVGVVMRKRNT